MTLTEHPYRTKRLFFRPIESPGDDEFFHALQADPFSHHTSSPSVLAPMTQETSSKVRKHFQEALLGVIICLPTTDENLALANGLYKKEDLLKTNPVRDEPLDQGIPIGAMSLDRNHSGARYIHTLQGDVGIDIAPRFQRRGYGREALEWLLDWGFNRARYHRIAIRVLGWNEGARKLYQSIGFRLESHEREVWWHDGRWWDDFGLGECHCMIG